jgi:hypothetical protein
VPNNDAGHGLVALGPELMRLGLKLGEAEIENFHAPSDRMNVFSGFQIPVHDAARVSRGQSTRHIQPYPERVVQEHRCLVEPLTQAHPLEAFGDDEGDAMVLAVPIILQVICGTSRRGSS